MEDDAVLRHRMQTAKWLRWLAAILLVAAAVLWGAFLWVYAVLYPVVFVDSHFHPRAMLADNIRWGPWRPLGPEEHLVSEPWKEGAGYPSTPVPYAECRTGQWASLVHVVTLVQARPSGTDEADFLYRRTQFRISPWRLTGHCAAIGAAIVGAIVLGRRRPLRE